MAGNTFGNLFRVTTWGESHGKAVGAVIDGCPAGIRLTCEDIQKHLDRRRPGTVPYSSSRNEQDMVEILSGTFDDVTLGTPISIVIYNNDATSSDYDDYKDIYRPSHADYTYDCKYGIRDYRGGGRASGRETAGRVAAGAVAFKLLEKYSIMIDAEVENIGNLPANEAGELLEECKNLGDSIGSTVVCRISGLMAGIGEPVFDKLDALLSQAMMSIPAVKGFEIGDGFRLATMKGSCANDCFCFENDTIKKHTNHSGGVLGGISDSSDVFFRVAFKPTPSIAISQDTVDKNGREHVISVKGRHDVCIGMRSPVIVEAMAAITIADLILQNQVARFSSL